MRFCIRALIFCLAANLAAAHADDLATMGRLSAIVESRCKQLKPIDRTDKLGCAFSFAYRGVLSRLKTLEKLDPASVWGKETFVTLASRMYHFNFLNDSPHGDLRIEIMAVQADMLILHRLLRQLTPHALTLAYPKLTGKNADLIGLSRIAAARAPELTPWSALLRQATIPNCFELGEADCSKNRATSLQILRNAVQLLAKTENLNFYVTEFSNTHEATENRSTPLIRTGIDVSNALLGEPSTFLLSPTNTSARLPLPPNLRDVVGYLAWMDRDLEAPVNVIISTSKLNCHTTFATLLALALEDATNPLRQAARAVNPFEAIAAAQPNLTGNSLKMDEIAKQHDCAERRAIEAELSARGLLTRFQAYQGRVLLLSSHDDSLSDPRIATGSLRYALISDVERVIRTVKAIDHDTGLKIEPLDSPAPQELVNFVKALVTP